MKNSKKIALCGLITALSVALMFLTGIFPAMTYAIPALSGLILVILAIEYGMKPALLAYVASSILSVIIAPDKEAALMFVAFFGYYPIIKGQIERIHSRIAEWIVKISLFNVTIVGLYLLMVFVLKIPNIVEEFSESSPWFAVGLFLLGNFVFIIYDICCTRMISAYIHALRKRIKNLF